MILIYTWKFSHFSTRLIPHAAQFHCFYFISFFFSSSHLRFGFHPISLLYTRFFKSRITFSTSLSNARLMLMLHIQLDLIFFFSCDSFLFFPFLSHSLFFTLCTGFVSIPNNAGWRNKYARMEIFFYSFSLLLCEFYWLLCVRLTERLISYAYHKYWTRKKWKEKKKKV